MLLSLLVSVFLAVNTNAEDCYLLSNFNSIQNCAKRCEADSRCNYLYTSYYYCIGCEDAPWDPDSSFNSYKVNDVDECVQGTHNCDVNAQCTNTDGSYSCECNAGYSGNGVTCADINECEGPNDCDVNAQCTNTDGSYSCDCNAGYSGHGMTCEESVLNCFSIDSGSYDNCAISNGAITCWGRDNQGQVSNAPTQTDFVSVSGNFYHYCGRHSSGAITCWGYDNYGQVSSTPTDTDFIAISTGYQHTCGLRSTGAITCWGNNGYGQAAPPTHTDFIAISSGGYQSCGLRSSGAIECWGRDNYAQVSNTPTNTDFVAISSGVDHNCGLKLNGAIMCWGYNYSSQVSNTPTNTDFVAISSGVDHNCGLHSSGAITCWGHNLNGQVSNTPTTADFVAVSGGNEHTCGLRVTGEITCWGSNGFGQVSDTPTQNDFIFVTTALPDTTMPDTTMPPRSAYHVGVSPSETCAPGTLIGNQQACKTAAGVLEDSSWDGTRDWSDRPYGCLFTSNLEDGLVNFNTNKDGAPSHPDQVVICNIAYYVGVSALETCAPEYLIDDVEACKTAAGAVGKWDGSSNWSDRPYGCLLTVADGNVNFNTNPLGAPSDPDQVVICDGPNPTEISTAMPEPTNFPSNTPSTDRPTSFPSTSSPSNIPSKFPTRVRRLLKKENN